MATLYQLHTSMDTLRRGVEEMSRTWRKGDSIILLGSTVAFIDWFNAYLGDSEIQGIAGIYALADDVAQLAIHSSNSTNANTNTKLNLEAKLSAVLTDIEWVNLTQNNDANNTGFDKVVTIAL